MKNLQNSLWILSLAATVACGGQSITGPTASSSQSSQASAPAASAFGADNGSASDASPSTPVPGGGTASSPQFTIQGPSGCVPAGSDMMRWVLNVSDSGPSPLRFIALAHQSPDPGCEHTIENPRPRVDVSGALNYAKHAAGQTSFTFDPRSFTCGRSQVDVSIFDAQGNETLIVGMVVDYKTKCAPPPPPPPAPELKCTPGGQTSVLNQAVNVRAIGGTGAYEWSSLGAPTRGSGASFSTAFGAAGSYSVVVTSGNATATCVVDVVTPPPPPPVVEEVACTPASQSVEVNAIARLAARGGNGTFSWSGGGSPATGSAAGFETAFASAGTYPVTVTSGGKTVTCEVTVTQAPPPPPPPALVCTPPASGSVLVNQAATFTASGGTGNYAWTGGGMPASGSEASFTTEFAVEGRYTVRVTSGEQSATCPIKVTVPPPPVPPLVCGPEVITVQPNKPATLTATGGTGVYTWSAEDGSPSTGSGATFTTQFAAPWSYRVYVTSGDQTAKCKVNVVE